MLQQELEEQKVSESTALRAVRMQGAADTPLLASLVQHRWVLLPAKLAAGLHELTVDHEQLVVIDSGPSGRPSAIAQDLGSTLSLRTLPDLDEDSAEDSTPRKKHRGRASQTVLSDVINIGWHILPGPVLHLDEPQGLQDIKPSRAIPDDIPCAESQASLRQRLHRAHRLSGSYLMIFR